MKRYMLACGWLQRRKEKSENKTPAVGARVSYKPPRYYRGKSNLEGQILN